MKASVLQSVAKIASRISNPSSLTSLYRSIKIGKESVQCCSEFGNLEIKLDPTGLENDCLIDTSACLAIATSLPGDAEITLEEKNNKINWKCSEAKGHLNQIVTDYQIPKITHENFPWEPSAEFPQALLLASSACQAAAVSVGLYGITIQPDGDRLHLMSSNSISLASATIDKGGYPFEKITIRPPVPAIIASLIGSCPDCKLDITEKGIFIKGSWLTAHLPLGINLDHDLKELASQFTKLDVVAKVDSKAVKKFIARAKVLSDKNNTFNVAIKVESGRLVLVHSGLSSSTEEFFLTVGLDTSKNYDLVSVPADMLLLPLEHIETVVFDYLPQQRVVMRGFKPDFLYVIGGGGNA